MPEEFEATHTATKWFSGGQDPYYGFKYAVAGEDFSLNVFFPTKFASENALAAGEYIWSTTTEYGYNDFENEFTTKTHIFNGVDLSSELKSIKAGKALVEVEEEVYHIELTLLCSDGNVYMIQFDGKFNDAGTDDGGDSEQAEAVVFTKMEYSSYNASAYYHEYKLSNSNNDTMTMRVNDLDAKASVISSGTYNWGASSTIYGNRGGFTAKPVKIAGETFDTASGSMTIATDEATNVMDITITLVDSFGKEQVFTFNGKIGGDDNTGDDNTGDDNTGDDNTGDDNTGDDNTGDDNVDVPAVPETPTAPQKVTGEFTCATYNVDGLPQKISIISINSDGPGSSGTSNISAKIASQNWDFVGFSEDFAYHSNLTSSLSNYQWGTYRGSVSSSALYKTIDTDGLEFAANKATCSWSSENITAFSSSYGGLTSGANTCIKKGFRHYVVTVAEGVEVDVIITHMNTYSSSGSGHINAQHAQLKQIAQYINNLVATNNRPVILMGDTNCRYTRHDFKTYFWDVLNSNLTYSDPWVDFQWNGVYPTYPSKSLMVSDATGTDSSTDIICADTQKGEVVDKIIYINTPNSPVQIKAESYLRDYDNFKGLADHMPIVVKFSFEKTISE